MKEQTAVEWLYEEFTKTNYLTEDEFYMKFNQAKEMEKEQISIAYKEGWNCPHGEGFPETGEQYYKQTYKQQ
jgi:hypothetical protein